MGDELAVVESVRRACLDAGEHDPLDEAGALHLKHRGTTGVDLWVAEESGFALRRGTEVDLAVAPAARRRGLGGSLAAQAFAADGTVTAWSHGDHPAAGVLARRHGLERARELWVMRRSSVVPLPDVAPPPGVRIRSYTDDDAPEVLRINAAAFAAHPEQGAMDEANLAERMAEPWWDPAGLLLAEDDDGVLGFHWTKQHGPELGEVYVVGIDPAAQGRGLGRLLTLAGLHHLVDGGAEEVLLYVESDNVPAVRVYSGLGFEHAAADTHVQYRRP